MPGVERPRRREERGRGKKRLTGEELTWFRIAAKTGTSVRRAKAEHTNSDFLKWEKYLDDEANEFHREDWNFAQVCFQLYLLRLSWTGGEVKLKLEDFIPKFVKAGSPKARDPVPPSPIAADPPAKKIQEMTDEEIAAEKVRISRQEAAIFFGAFGLNPDGSPMHKPK